MILTNQSDLVVTGFKLCSEAISAIYLTNTTEIHIPSVSILIE